MMDSRKLSIILTGSDLNHRTFDADESWNSLQSTILAGNISANDSIVERKELATVDEESSSMPIIEEGEDILNTNIDAIDADDETFFDCPSYSPQYSPKKCKKSPTFAAATMNGESRLTISSSGVSSLEERTGSLLTQMIYDFNEKKVKAQSTPNSDIENNDSVFHYGSLEESHSNHIRIIKTNNDSFIKNTSSKRKISFSSEENPQILKMTKILSTEEKSRKPDWKSAKVVAKMKEFFECKIEESRNSVSSRNSNTSKLSVHRVSKSSLRPKSPTFRITAVPKLKITPALLHLTPSKKNRNRSVRPSSCSDYQSEESTNSHIVLFNRSRCRSDSDVSSGLESDLSNSEKLKKAIHRKRVLLRPGFITSRKVTLHKNSPKNQSAISKRRSVGMEAKSPIKPVRILRKVFSPSKINVG